LYDRCDHSRCAPAVVAPVIQSPMAPASAAYDLQLHGLPGENCNNGLRLLAHFSHGGSLLSAEE